MEPSPELDAFLKLIRRMHLRLVAEGKWDEIAAKLEADAAKRECAEAKSSIHPEGVES